MDEYQKRPKFFACRVIRLLGKTCAAQEIGCTGAFLVTWVAMTEDAAGYSRAVTFYDGQLLPIMGLESQKALAKARAKAVEAGWLHYVAGCKGRAGRYWSQIPAHAGSHDDNPSDEGHDSRPMPRQKDGESAVKRASNRGGSDGESVGESGTIGQGKGQPFFPIPIPRNTPLPPNGGNRRKTGKRKRDPLLPITFSAMHDWASLMAWVKSHGEKFNRIPGGDVEKIQEAALTCATPDEFVSAVHAGVNGNWGGIGGISQSEFKRRAALNGSAK